MRDTDATQEARIIPKDVVDTLEIVFTIIFASEFSTRVIAKGLFWTKDAYLKSGWNIADSVVLFFSILDSTQLLTDGGVAKVMRLTRALRPLRLMKRNVGMKVLVDALLSALYPSAYVALFALWTTFVFAVFGMGLFQELLDQCSAPGAEYPGGKIECSGFHVTNDGFMLPRAWVKPFPNWDTIDTSMLLLFQLSNNRYVVPLQSVMDVTQRNLSPKVDHSAGNSLFIVSYIVISSMFIFSIFTGFIIDGFNVPQGPDPESELNFGRFLRAVKEFAPRVEKYSPPKNKFSVMLRQIVQHKFFSSFTFSTVAVSIIFILLDHDDPSPEFMLVFQNQELVLFWLLVLEIILVVGAYGHAVLNDPWKGLDVLVCIGTAIGIFADRPEISRSARCFRVLRIIRLLKTVKAIRVILDTLISSIPQVANIVALIFLFWSIFAVAFNQLYSNVKYGFRIGPNLNFKTYYDALRTVYQIVTGEPWPILIEDSRVTWPSCTPIFSTKYPEYNYQGPDYEFGDCGDQFSPALFVVCILFCNCIMINLFIGMVLDNFSFFTENAADGNVLLDETGTRVIWTSLVSQVHVISQIYKFFDFSNTGLVPISSLFRMMLESPQPLGFGGKYSPADKAAFKVIRAELNVRCLTKWHLQKNQPWYIKTSDRILFTLFGGLQRNSSHMRVTFEDYIMTLFYWRKSESVPAMLQQMRVKGLSKILTMSQALIIRDFMWGFGPTINRRSQVLKTIKPRRIFFKWGKGDKWYCRYRTYKLDVVQKAAAKAARNVLFRNILPGYPNCTFLAMFTPLEDPPIGDSRFISVPRAVIDCQTRSSYQASLFAIESFLKMTRGNSHEVKMPHYVVCRFVDDRTVVRKKWGDVVWLADFSTVEWFEWNITQVQEQAYLEPKIMPDRCDEATPKWSEVKMRYNMAKWQRLRNQRKNMTEEAKGLRARAALMGLASSVDYDEECLVLNVRSQSEFSSLIAVQAYMVANRQTAEPECALRLILGTHSLAPSDVRERHNFELGLQKCRDCVVEVLGYVPKLVAARATDFIIAKDEESEKDRDSESEKQSESAAPSEAAIDQENENPDASGEEENDENSEGEGEYRNNDEGGDEDGEEERGAVKELPEAQRRVA